MRILKIAMITSWFHPFLGGAEVFAYEISKKLVEEKNKVFLITRKFSSDLKSHVNYKGIEVFRVPILNINNLRSLSFILPSFFKIIQLHKEHSLDFIHAHLAFPSGVIGYLCKSVLNIPLMISVQGGDIGDYIEFTGKFGGVLVPFIKKVLVASDFVHVVSNYLKVMVLKFGTPKNKIRVIPNGVDTNVFSPRARDLTKGFRDRFRVNGPLIISISRLVPKNGLETLIRSFKEVLRKFPDAKLMLVGKGYLENELRKLSSILGIENSVIFCGYIPHNVIPSYLASANVFVRVPVSEGFGIAFIESMACGVPVIGSKIGGIVDIINHGKNGMLVDPNDVKATSEAIIKILSDNQLAQKLALNGRKTVLSKFNWEGVYGLIKSSYEKLVLN